MHNNIKMTTIYNNANAKEIILSDMLKNKKKLPENRQLFVTK